MATAKAHSSSSESAALLSDSERAFLLQGIRDNCRIDGRDVTTFRRRLVETGVFRLSHGSARILATNNINNYCWCSVKAELVRPAWDTPASGSVGVEWSPTTDDHQQQQQKQQQQRLAFMEDWCNAALGPKLCIEPGVAAWKLHVDVTSQGEVSMTTIAQCIRYALADTILPCISIVEEDATVVTTATGDLKQQSSVLDRIYLENGNDGQPIVSSVEELPCLVTIHIMDQAFAILDATLEEDLVSDCIVYVVVGPDQSVWGVSTKGRLPLSMVDNCIPFAVQAVPSLREAYKVTTTNGILQEQ